MAHNGWDSLCELGRDWGGVEQWLMCEKEVTKRSKEGENSYTEKASLSLRSYGHKWVNFKILLKVQDPQQTGPQIEGEHMGTHKTGLWMLYIKKYHEVLFPLCLVEFSEKKE